MKNTIFYLTTLIIFTFLCKYSLAGDEFYDNRCICVCPSFKVIQEEETNRKVYIAVLNKDNCSCENVLSKWKPNKNETLKTFCPRCTCNYETRNTTTMKVVVIIIICILALLFIYMGFLLCLDPLLNKRVRMYQQQVTEDISMSSDARTPNLDDDDEDSDDQPFSTPQTRSNVINRVTQEQSKWKKQVQEQRRTVFDNHVLLN